MESNYGTFTFEKHLNDMYRVDGLIEYYFQRKISGMDSMAIAKSLDEQRHIENEDREIILKEVERREKLYQKQISSRRMVKASYFVGLGLVLVSLISYFMVKNGSLNLAPLAIWGPGGGGILISGIGFIYSRSLRIS